MFGMQYVLPGLLFLMMLTIFGVVAGVFLLPLILVLWLSSHVYNNSDLVRNRNLRWLARGLALISNLYTFVVIDILVLNHFHYYLAIWPFQLGISLGLYGDAALAIATISVATIILERNCEYPAGMEPPDIPGTLVNILLIGLLLGSIGLGVFVGSLYGWLVGIGAFAGGILAMTALENLIKRIRAAE